MKKIIMLKGLQGSGKSTWAKQHCEDHPEFVRISKDDIRLEYFPNCKRSDESEVVRIEEKLTIDNINNGNSVILDSTNLNPKHEERFRKLANAYGVELEINDSFLSVPVQECIERDKCRDKPVGEKVIRDTYYKFLYKPEQVKWIEGLPICVIFDVDGSLADSTGVRSVFDYTKVINDKPIIPTVNLAKMCHANYYKVFIMSGREDVCREQTEEWLERYDIVHNGLFMRKVGDNRDDAVVKEELFNEHIRGKYNVQFVVDDRKKVKRKWVSMGLFVLDVNQKDSEF